MNAVNDPLLEALRRSQLLEAGQLQELAAQLPPSPVDGTALARVLLRRAWMTPYQVQQLVQGKVEELVLGEYVLLEVLGQGGIGRVFKARQRRLNRLCALKVILPGRLQDPGLLARFHREAAAAAMLDHANIVRVYDASESRGVHYLVLEFIDGTDLRRALKRLNPLPVASVCSWIRQAALGLQHAHEQGLVHRDLKPSNLMLTRKGVVKVLDLGLVQLGPLVSGSGREDLTAPGTVIGTADYLAPEQASDCKKVDIRADLYSLGCTLYHLLTGQVPFAGYTLAGKVLAHQQTIPVDVQVRRPEVPTGLARIVSRLLAKHPAQRYQTPDQVAVALRPFTQGATVPREVFPGPEGEPDLGGTNPLTRASCPSDLSPTVPKDSSCMMQLTPSFGASSTLHTPAPRRRPGMGMALAAGTAIVCASALIAAILLRNSQGQVRPGPGEEPVKPGTGPAEKKPSEPALPPQAFENSVGIKLVRIPKGKFLMGSPPGEVKRMNNEAQHEVTITRPFYLGAYEVTQEQYRTVMGKNPSHFSRAGGGKVYVLRIADDDLKRFPVENVSWEEASTFCRRLSDLPEEKRLGRVYRLPTEAEWEYTCRAGVTSLPFHYGDRLSSTEANFFGNEPYGQAAKGPYLSRTSTVGSYQPNAWGLYDMHGNVWEWCSDWLAWDPGTSPKVDPRGPESGKDRCVRGGSWGNPSWDCRSASRGSFDPNKGYPHVGFRVACDDRTTDH